MFRARPLRDGSRAGNGPSVNSANDLYGKIRTYFFEAGLFMDFYGGTGWAQYDPEADREFEQSLLAFHRQRLRRSRGVSGPKPVSPTIALPKAGGVSTLR